METHKKEKIIFKDMGILNKKYLDRGDLAELRKRVEQINQYLLVAESLEMVKNGWLTGKLSKYGLDSTKQYDINGQTGQIKEHKKDEPRKN